MKKLEQVIVLICQVLKGAQIEGRSCIAEPK